MSESKRYFAPLPNRVLVDERMHGLHLRFYGVVAAHDRFGENGIGSTLSLQRYAEILSSHKQSIARVRRQMIDWGYLKEADHPRHSQMKMLSIVYDADADKVALFRKTVSPQADGSPPSTVSLQVHGCAKTVSPQADTEETHLKVKEETRMNTKEESSLEGARSGERASRGEGNQGLSLDARLAIMERRLKEMKERPSTSDVPILENCEEYLQAIAAEHDGHTGDPVGGRALRLIDEIGWILEQHG